jgi:hypothetical protein
MYNPLECKFSTTQPPRLISRWLCFITVFFIHQNITGQDTLPSDPPFFEYNKKFDFSISNNQIIGRSDIQLQWMDSTSGFICTGIDNKKRLVFIQEISFANGKCTSHEIAYSKKTKFDFRENFHRIVHREGNELFLLGSKGKLFVVDLLKKTMKVKIKKSVQVDYLKINGQKNIGAAYSDPSMQPICMLSVMDFNGKELKKIDLDGGFFEFTHFAPNRLVTFSDRYIFLLNISKPTLFVYDFDLNLVDSLQFCPNRPWSSAESIAATMPQEELHNMDLFTHGATLLEKGAFKNWSVQLVNDSTLLITSSLIKETFLETLVHCTPPSELRILANRTTPFIPKDKSERLMLELNFQTPLGLAYKNIFCYLKKNEFIRGSAMQPDKSYYSVYLFHYVRP